MSRSDEIGTQTSELEKPLDTTVDESVSDCQEQKHKSHKQALERSFSWLGATGLAFTISNSWIAYATTFGTVLTLGGGQATLFAVIVSGAAQWVVLLGLAELSSAFPSSGGHYYFTYFLAPKSTRNFTAFLVGTLNLMGWWTSAASSLIYTTMSAFAMAMFWDPGFQPQHWQLYLGYVLVIFLTLLPIFTIPQRQIDNMTQVTFALSLGGLLVTILVLLVMGRDRYHPELLIDRRNTSGWPEGPAWMLSIGLGEYCFAAAGSIVHVAEEMPRPARSLPWVINMTMVVGVSTVIPWVAVMLCGIQDVEAVQKAWIPSLEVFHQATGSKLAATILQGYLTLLYYTTIPAQWVTCSRVAWTFARDNGLPFSRYWSSISPHYNFPVRTTLLSAGFCLLCGLVYIPSTAAFTSIVNTSVLLVNIAYTVPQAMLALGLRDRLPASHFQLGRWGYTINIFSVVWLVVTGVVFCLPVQVPVTSNTMNYGSAALVGMFLVTLLMYVERRGEFAVHI